MDPTLIERDNPKSDLAAYRGPGQTFSLAYDTVGNYHMSRLRDSRAV